MSNRIRRAAAKSYKRTRNRITRPGAKFEKLWEGGIDSELGFWRNYLAAAEGGTGREEYRFRMDPNSPLQASLVELLPDQERIGILDVGAGPLTNVGKIWPGHDVEVRAVDALADDYNSLLLEANITPPVATECCHSEELAKMFEPDSFDLVYALNSLDHSYDPMTAIRQMARIGRVVYLEHHSNEAERQGYSGLHLWNFDVVGDTCLLWRPGTKYELGAELAPAIVSGRKTVGIKHDDNLTYITIRRNENAPRSGGGSRLEL